MIEIRSILKQVAIKDKVDRDIFDLKTELEKQIDTRVRTAEIQSKYLSKYDDFIKETNK